MADDDDTPNKAAYPAWVKDLVFLIIPVATIIIYAETGKSDTRSNTEKLNAVVSEMTSIRADLKDINARLPNAEVLNLRFREIEGKIETLKSDVEFEKAKTQSLRERLIKKGWIE